MVVGLPTFDFLKVRRGTLDHDVLLALKDLARVTVERDQVAFAEPMVAHPAAAFIGRRAQFAASDDANLVQMPCEYRGM